MTDHQATTFMEHLDRLAELLDTPMTPGRLTGYVETLRDLELVDLEAAIARAGRECQFFPKPVDLRAFASESRQKRLQAARTSEPMFQPLSEDEQRQADEAYQVFMAKAREVLRRRSFPEAGR